MQIPHLWWTVKKTISVMYLELSYNQEIPVTDIFQDLKHSRGFTFMLKPHLIPGRVERNALCSLTNFYNLKFLFIIWKRTMLINFATCFCLCIYCFTQSMEKVIFFGKKLFTLQQVISYIANIPRSTQGDSQNTNNLFDNHLIIINKLGDQIMKSRNL